MTVKISNRNRILQWCAIEFLHLLHKPYGNGGTLSQDYRPSKSLKSLELCPPNKHKVDLSNEVLIIDFGQQAAKISKIKVSAF